METLPSYFSGFLAVLLLTCFVKMLTTLSILRYGIGLQGAGFGVVTTVLAFALSLLVMSSQPISESGTNLGQTMLGLIEGRATPDAGKLEEQARPFLEKNAHKDIKDRLTKLSNKIAARPTQEDTAPTTGSAEGTPTTQTKGPDNQYPILITAFLLSELKEAFQIGFILLIPFLVIDLLVANAMLALGVTQMSQALISLPLKILLFFAVDGWTLVSEKLISGYLQGN